MMQHRQNLLGRWYPRARIGRALAVGATLAACAAPHVTAAAGPGRVADEPIASMVDPEDDTPAPGPPTAERVPPPLLSEREVDAGIDIRLHRMRDSREQRAQRSRDRATDAAVSEAPPLPQQPPAHTGVHAPDDSAE